MESGLFLRPHEIIHSKHDGLWYRVHIRIVEIQDWNLSSDSSDDGTPPDNFDSDEDEYPGFEQRSRYKPWPKRTRFDDAAGSGGGPQLGPGWGLPFMSRDHVGAPTQSAIHLVAEDFNRTTFWEQLAYSTEPLRLPLRFGRGKSERHGPWLLCKHTHTPLLLDPAATRITSNDPGPSLRAFEPMLLDGFGQRVPLTSRVGQDGDDNVWSHPPLPVFEDRWDPMLTEAAVNVAGALRGSASPRLSPNGHSASIDVVDQAVGSLHLSGTSVALESGCAASGDRGLTTKTSIKAATTGDRHQVQ